MTDTTETPETDEVVETAVETPPAPTWTEADAEEAKAFGWKAPEDWVGDKPAGYIDDPRRYMDRAENFRPFKAMRERADKERADFEDRLRRSDAMSTKALEAMAAQHEAEKARLTAQQRSAVELGDVAQYDDLTKQIAAMKPVERPVVQTYPVDNTYVREYAAKNEWTKDPLLFDFARNAIDVANRSGKTFANAEEQVAYAEGKVREFFPHKFAAAVVTAVPGPARVDGGGLGGGGQRDAFTALPAEAKSAFQKFVTRGVYKDDAASRQSYARDYNA